MEKLRFLIAPDSFKGSLTSPEVCDAISEGLKKSIKNIEIIKISMADGGEGTASVITSNCNGEMKTLTCIGQMGEVMEVKYGVLKENKTAILDVASCCGIEMLDKNIRTPIITSSRVVGEVISFLLDEGYRKFIIGLGGSGTNDGGVGMLQYLGARFVDNRGNDINPIGGELINIYDISLDKLDERLHKSEFIIACDVNNPIIGKNGATHVFARQKGATDEEVDILELGMMNYVNKLMEKCNIDISNIPGAGAAGGLGGAFYLLNGKMSSGIDIILELSNFEEKLESCDIIITGEGSIDNQTKYGKTISGIAKRVKNTNKIMIVLAGCVEDDIDDLYDIGITSIFFIQDKPKTLERAIADGYKSLVKSSENIGRIILKLLQ